MQKIICIEDMENFLNMCSGCRLCELMCAFKHHNEGNARLSRIKIVDMQHGKKVPVVCQQCNEAPCDSACPTGALGRQKGSRAVLVNQGRCIGCGICVNICPVGAININRATGTAFKCDLCNGDPQCVKYCPSKVLNFASEQQQSYIKRKRYATNVVEAGRKEETERNGGVA